MRSAGWTGQRVCVGIPVYNGARFLEATIADVLRQTHRNFELVVFDDGSTDATPELVERLARSDSRIALHRGEENRGRGHARNRLLELAAGAIIAWQDADDRWHPRKLELQLGVLGALLAQGTRAVVLSTYEVATAGERQPAVRRPPAFMDAAHVFGHAYRDYPFQLQAAIGEADLFRGVGGFDDALNWSEDIDVALKLIRAGVLLVGHDAAPPLATYNHSLRCARAGVIEQSQAVLLARFGDFAREHGHELERILALRNVGYLGQVYLQSDRPQRALEVALRALVAVDPADPGDVERIGGIARVMMAALRPGGGGAARAAGNGTARPAPAGGPPQGEDAEPAGVATPGGSG